MVQGGGINENLVKNPSTRKESQEIANKGKNETF